MDPRAQLYDFPSKDLYKLERIRLAAKKMLNPQLGRRTILVAGTNGKGSVCSYLSHLFLSSGKKVGSYYSPHVISEMERIQIDAKNIDQEFFDQICHKHRETLNELTYFEKMTLVSFLVFRELHVDVQVLEVGMGGRLDATNICEPDLSVIVALGLDHQEVLGESLQKIAFEKCGIMRPEKKCFALRPADQNVTEEMLSYARKQKSDLFFEDSFELPSEVESQIHDELISFPSFQKYNARLAAKTYLEACKLWGWQPAFPSGVFLAAQLKARLQLIKKEPPQICDGGHNLQAVVGLRDYLKNSFADQKFVGVFGGMQDKPLEEIFSQISPWLSELRLVSFYPERECPPAELKERLQKLYAGKIQIEESLKNLKKELKDKPVLCFGSFYLVGQWLQDEN